VHPRRQGDIGEASAIEWLTSIGALVAKPLFHSPDYDVIAEIEGRLVRIEVKTCTRRTPYGRWEAQLCTHGGNQSWTGTAKLFDPRRCDYVFVHVGDGRRWFLPTSALQVARSVCLGGKKYAGFEIASGAPLPAETTPRSTSTIALP
jgi:Holliday junction resolvase-like predicted endonuclease